MPNRLLREGICTSDAINELTAEEEVMFTRLLVVADDYGHMDGRPAILKAQCFPLKETATVARIETWVAGLVRKSMLARYRSGGRLYLAINKWESRVRTHPKYPLPTDADWEDVSAVCAQVADRPPTSDSKAPPGFGLGMGLGMGASSGNKVAFDAATGNFVVPEALNSQWRQAYPAVNLDVELSKASAWLLANPKNAKSNYARFLTNWLAKAQDRAPRVAAPVQADAFAGGV